MKILPVNGHGPCYECRAITKHQLWIGKLQLFICPNCVDKLSKEAIRFSNDYKIELMHMTK